MKSKILTPVLISLCAFALAGVSANAASVILNVDASFEGFADNQQNPLTLGVFQVGWFDESITDASIRSYFADGNVSAIASAFHNVATITDLNSYGPGLPFESLTLVPDGQSLAGYINSVTGAAGKHIYGWLLSGITGSPLTSTQQAIVTSDLIFPTAADGTYYSDYEATFGTDSYAVGINVLVGAIQPITIGSGVDAGEGLGVNGGSYVLTTEEVPFAVIPEPGSWVLLGIGTVGMLLFRRIRRTAQPCA